MHGNKSLETRISNKKSDKICFLYTSIGSVQITSIIIKYLVKSADGVFFFFPCTQFRLKNGTIQKFRAHWYTPAVQMAPFFAINKDPRKSGGEVVASEKNDHSIKWALKIQAATLHVGQSIGCLRTSGACESRPMLNAVQKSANNKMRYLQYFELHLTTACESSHFGKRAISFESAKIHIETDEWVVSDTLTVAVTYFLVNCLIGSIILGTINFNKISWTGLKFRCAAQTDRARWRNDLQCLGLCISLRPETLFFLEKLFRH